MRSGIAIWESEEGGQDRDDMSGDLWNEALRAWEGGRVEEAAGLLAELLAATPGHVDAHHLCGVVLLEMGRTDESIAHLRLVCDAEPANGEALANLGNALLQAGRLADAESVLRSGLAHNAADVHLQFNLGMVLAAANRPTEAEAAFLRVSELDPEDQDTWLQLGLARYAVSNSRDAAAAFLRAAAAAGPRREEAVRLAGFALLDGGRPEEAEPLLAGLCGTGPELTDDFHVLAQLLYCRLELCDWRQLPQIVERCRRFVAAGEPPVEPFTFLLLPEVGPEEQLRLTSSFVRGMVRGGGSPARTDTHADPERRLRIAYLSGDFHDHAVARLMTGVLELHDHDRFEIHAFSYGGDDRGEQRRRIVAACDRFHDVTGLSLQELAAAIRDQRIDILLDLTGWTGNTRTAVLGLRPAPIQVNWLGYSGTFGSRVLADYLIGDAIATPMSHQHHFAEEIVLMPACCQPNDASRPIGRSGTRAEHGLPEHALVFCCFCRPVKISPRMFDCWCDLLLEVPDSVLWLYEGNAIAKENLFRYAAARGIETRRIIFTASLPPEAHLGRLALADLALDTFPFGSHTTASDALWAGLPVLTLMGETFQSRVTASMLHAVGLPDLVTQSLDDYRARAIALGRDRDALAACRRRLEGNRRQAPLFDTRGYAIAFESRLREMWRRYCLAR
jgi:predicted O-linked N-acetylglucosamine transferase (SPINDLY family)